MNDELSPYYSNMQNNERGTAFSEENANCIADYFLDPSNFGCVGNKRQAAYNIIHGKPASAMVIDEHFSGRIRLSETGYAISEAECSTDAYCEQEFENGSAIWVINEDGSESLEFDSNRSTIVEKFYRAYFYPSVFEKENLTEYSG